MAATKKRQIVYEIKAKLYFDLDEDIIISEYLDNLRGIGTANVVDVHVEEVES